jgi:hypothetical protein
MDSTATTNFPKCRTQTLGEIKQAIGHLVMHLTEPEETAVKHILKTFFGPAFQYKCHTF